MDQQFLRRNNIPPFAAVNMQDRLLVNDFDVSTALYDLQQTFAQENERLSIADHFHRALTCNNIPLLSHNRNPHSLDPHFNNTQIIQTVKNVKKQYNMYNLSLPNEHMMEIVELIDEAANKMEPALQSVLDHLEIDTPNPITESTRKLPRGFTEEAMNEEEFYSSNIHPFSSKLIDDNLKNDVAYQWQDNLTTNEAKKNIWRPVGEDDDVFILEDIDLDTKHRDLVHSALDCETAMNVVPVQNMHPTAEVADTTYSDSIGGLPHSILDYSKFLLAPDVFNNYSIPFTDESLYNRYGALAFCNCCR